MKYWIDDGTERGAFFENQEEAERYEHSVGIEKQLRAEAASYLDMKNDWPKDEKSARRERTKAETWIHGWLAYDLRQRPERYGFEAAAEVEPITTVAPPMPVFDGPGPLAVEE